MHRIGKILRRLTALVPCAAALLLVPGLARAVPTVTVIAPNGGETWAVSSNQMIQWSATDAAGIASVTLESSTDGGVTWHNIVSNVTNTGTYAWYVPYTARSTTARIRVIAQNTLGQTASDVSNANFTVRDDSEPEIEVTYPNGGEVWEVGSKQTIRYTAFDNSQTMSIDIDKSIDGGASFTRVNNALSATGTYVWTVSNVPTTTALIRVIGTDPSDNTGRDSSDAFFEIRPSVSPVVAVLSPNGGESLPEGTSQAITWNATDNVAVTSVKLEYTINGGSTWTTIANNIANTGTYAWSVPYDSRTSTARVRITAKDFAGNTTVDVSDGLFSIVDGIPPTVTVTQPNGGEVWTTGSSQMITWTANDVIAFESVMSVDVHYSLDNGATWTAIVTGAANTGSLAWTVPGTATTAARVRVTAHDGLGNTGDDVSDGSFTIPDQAAPAVTVLSPNGGEGWRAGEVHDITWTATDASGVNNVDLSYSVDGGFTWTSIAIHTLNTGSYPWVIPNAATTTARIRVTARDMSLNMASDQSDANFTLLEGTAPAVLVHSPNGDETWVSGQTRSITWTALDDVAVTSIAIDYSTDGGATWTAVATGLPNTGSYAWTVPNTPTAQARVRVSAADAANNVGTDVSNANFTIDALDVTPPSVALTSPIGGETWGAGQVRTITWTASDDVAVGDIDLEYSTDGGGTWTPIVAGLANSGSYGWTLPQVATITAQVRVTAHDLTGNTAQATSAAFSILDQTAPAVAVTQPNGGESWAGGSSKTITWTASDAFGVTLVTIDYSLDHGASWTTITTVPNSGSYAWTLPHTPSTQARVRITAVDAALNSASDASDGDFTIVDQTPPTVTVTAPNGGETLAVGSTADVAWTSADDVATTGVDIAWSTDGGATWQTVATNAPDTGHYAWLVPGTPTTTGRVRVTARDAGGNTGVDASDTDFTIADVTAPTVSVTAPNGGETWGAGTVHAITWTASDDAAVTTIDLDYSVDGGATWTVVAAGLANTGSYAWSVPATLTTNARVRATAHDAASHAASDASDAAFTISDATAPTATVTAPNGGESWATGSVHAITWTAADDIGVTGVDLDYSLDGGASWVSIATGFANSGSYAWTLPATPSANARVRVTAHDAAAHATSDASDAAFSITDGEAPTAHLLTPNGGESWLAGTSHPITWTATDNVAVVSVDLAYSLDDGATWSPIATGTTNTGNYNWVVPQVASTHVRVRVTARDAASLTGGDMSDAAFTIPDVAPPSVALISPNGGQYWLEGTAHAITWSASDNVGVTAIDLELSLDGGATWSGIAYGIANTGSYAWTLPTTPTMQGHVRVTAYDGVQSAQDGSDTNFRILDATPTYKVLDLRADRVDGTNPPASPTANIPWKDLTSGHHDATTTGFPGTPSSGWRGDGTVASPYRLQFTGTERVTIPSGSIPELQTVGPLTAEVWFKTSMDANSDRYDYVMEWVQKPTPDLNPEYEGRGLSIMVQDGTIQVYNATPWVIATPVTPDTWYHVAVVKDTLDLRVYVNGQKLFAGIKPHQGIQESQMVLGCSVFREFESAPSPYGELYHGAIAQACVWKGALDDDAVLAEFRADSAKYFPQPAVPAVTPVVELRGDRANGVTHYALPSGTGPWMDIAGPASNATLRNFNGTSASGWVGGPNTYVLQYDGVDDCVTIAAGSVPELTNTRAYAMDMWFRTPSNVASPVYQYLMDWLESFGNSTGMGVAVYNGTLQVYFATPYWTDVAPVTPNTWYHLIVTKEPGEARVYLNGTRRLTIPRPLFGNPYSEIAIGCSTWRGTGQYADFYSGQIGETRLYVGAHDDAAAMALYNATLPRYQGAAAAGDPIGLQLQLAGAKPNPAVNHLDVSFTLPSAHPATLELLDVTGRRVASRDVGTLGPGRHSIRLDDHGRLPVGVYMIRLSQAGQALVTKAAVVH